MAGQEERRERERERERERRELLTWTGEVSDLN